MQLRITHTIMMKSNMCIPNMIIIIHGILQYKMKALINNYTCKITILGYIIGKNRNSMIMRSYILCNNILKIN